MSDGPCQTREIKDVEQVLPSTEVDCKASLSWVDKEVGSLSEAGNLLDGPGSLSEVGIQSMAGERMNKVRHTYAYL